mmetsp:Transcript_10877/g.16787  ORF Transcript_10877/g.16787 Transcript_10877/m.16787 type:complete len:123 (-) Transcript_10877:773-1141(-)|eukprot:CAMPEP_0195285408 /NCGR_PEP_ID=MMETSP0707-20130614/3253_1 /TAXON_ID=33640 /ORGANISM="Asterionellopsis glacialis, Strain CCMP134" /LENGTH=122 /DNA_ID=CAMNT_0040344897 /DNA_START=13 /DNA_END=381 /DNA_ORIENTATION=-
MNHQPATFDTALTKKLILHHQPKERINADAVATANELLRLFVVEARQRAAVEAECENEGAEHPAKFSSLFPSPRNKENEGLASTSKNGGGTILNDETTANSVVPIRADHITKIAAGLLMDFS